MVAVVLFSLFALMSLRALDAVLTAERHARAQIERWQAFARAFHRVETDLADAVPPAASPQTGHAGFVVTPLTQGGLEMSFKRQRPQDFGSGLFEVRYRYAERQITRSERTMNATPTASVLIDGVEHFAAQFMDASGAWREEWPPERPSALPRALKWELTLSDGTKLTRIWRLQ